MTGSSIQTAIVLDELPLRALAVIEEKQEDLEAIKVALRGNDVKLSGYFDKITDHEEQVKFTAENIHAFFTKRRARKQNA